MAVKRRSGGGRKPTVLPNPFITMDEWGDIENVLWLTEDELDIRIEDILVGCVRAFNTGHNQDYINWYKLLRVYRNVQELSVAGITNYLMCSESTARRYMQVIKLANPFIRNYMNGKSGSNVRGYIHLTKGQVKHNYTPPESKEGAQQETSKHQENTEWLQQISQLVHRAE